MKDGASFSGSDRRPPRGGRPAHPRLEPADANQFPHPGQARRPAMGLHFSTVVCKIPEDGKFGAYVLKWPGHSGCVPCCVPRSFFGSRQLIPDVLACSGLSFGGTMMEVTPDD